MNTQTNSALRDLLARFDDYVDLTDLIDNAEEFARVLIAHCHDLVIVPREPTSEMCFSGVEPMFTENVIDSSVEGKCGRIYKAMLAATQPAAQEK